MLDNIEDGVGWGEGGGEEEWGGGGGRGMGRREGHIKQTTNIYNDVTVTKPYLMLFGLKLHS